MVGLTELTQKFSDLENRVEGQSLATTGEEIKLLQDQVNGVKQLLHAEKTRLYLLLNPEE